MRTSSLCIRDGLDYEKGWLVIRRHQAIVAPFEYREGLQEQLGPKDNEKTPVVAGLSGPYGSVDTPARRLLCGEV